MNQNDDQNKNPPRDVHRETAARIFNCSPDQRRAARALNFRDLYRSSQEAALKALGCPQAALRGEE